MVEIENLIVMAKAIPSISPTRGELTCVAGITDDDDWIRLYPVPTGLLGQSYFKKFDQIQVKVDKWKGAYPRPEDRFLVEYIKKIGSINDWEERKTFLSRHLDSSVDNILSNGRSLGIIKPIINDFYQDENNRCRYRFNDSIGDSYDLVCRDWELQGLLNRYPDDFGKVKDKFLNWMSSRDTHFVIGTTSDNVNKMVVSIH